MAPSKKEKKVVNQEELRRLMREKQRQSTEKKRVDSPFAKYNSLGHLSCVLCNVHVKSELLWPTHILGKQHKEKVAELKGAKTPTVTQQPQPVKRKAADREDVSGKKAKPPPGPGQGAPGQAAPELDDGVFKKPLEKESVVPKNTASLTLLAGVYDDNEEDNDDGDEEETGSPNVPPQVAEAAGLPADFFDSSIPSTPAISHSGSILKADGQEKMITEKKENTAESLPEGFFDDPVRDAKVRNVDAPKDQLDKEWEEFQKEMRLVNTKSEAIVAEDDEEGRIERQIDEIDEQIECYRRVEVLRDRREAVKSRPLSRKDKQVDMDTNTEEEGEDEDELLGLLSQDWRAKGALA